MINGGPFQMNTANLIDVKMPNVGGSVDKVDLVKWHKFLGDIVSEEETLLEISCDKMIAEIPSPVQGTLIKVFYQEGDQVAVGEVVAQIEHHSCL